jgi:diadenosine tetraphosphatase ApaH/serine/threonine PP2A family protein phosphatase
LSSGPLALLYDIHGNLPALEAVLADATPAGAREWVLGGDYALFGGWPAETVARLHELDSDRPTYWVRGNGERWTANPGDAPENEVVPEAIRACYEALGPQTVEQLDNLPERCVLPAALFCHASPKSDVESFLPEPGEDETQLLAGVDAPRIVFGHTHLQFAREGPGGIELVNPGSIGMPFDGDPRAAYALLHDDGRVEQRRVSYDHEASAARVSERFGGAPWTEVVSRRIATATI